MASVGILSITNIIEERTMDPQQQPQPQPQQQYAQPPQQQPQPVGPAYPAAPPQQTNVLAIFALILGIIAFLTGIFPFFGAVVGLVAIILGSVALRKQYSKGMAIAGLVLGAIGMLTSIAMSVLFVIALNTTPAKPVTEAEGSAARDSLTNLLNDNVKSDFGIGEVATFGPFKVKVDKVTENYQGGTVKLYPGPAENYVHVNFTITNASEEPQKVQDIDFPLEIDGQYAMSEYNPEADDFSIINKTLKPGESVSYSMNVNLAAGSKASVKLTYIDPEDRTRAVYKLAIR